MKFVFYATVNAGRVKFAALQYLTEILKGWEGCDVAVTFERKKAKRSNNQNAYYWGVVVPVVRQGLGEAGYNCNREQVHEFLKAQFAKREIVNEETGECLSYPGSTATMKKGEFAEFVADVQVWALDFLNVTVPAPGEQLTIDN